MAKRSKRPPVYLRAVRLIDPATGQEGSVALWFDPMSNQYLGRETHRPHPIVNWSNRQGVAA